MLACVDVDYRDQDARAVAACLLFHAWPDELPAREETAVISQTASYVPGEFYKRELPCLVEVLKQLTEPLEAIVIDGYVWLDDAHMPGLGARLFEALSEGVPVIGVAKNSFKARSSRSASPEATAQNLSSSPRRESTSTRPPRTSRPCTARIASPPS